jgi:hypothetical protein
VELGIEPRAIIHARWGYMPPELMQILDPCYKVVFLKCDDMPLLIYRMTLEKSKDYTLL